MGIEDEIPVIQNCTENIMSNVGILWDKGRELREHSSTELYGRILSMAANVVIMAMSEVEWIVKKFR